MNKLQSAILLIVTVAAALAITVGCTSTQTVTANPDGTFTTNSTQTIDTNRVDRVANQAAIDGTTDILAQHPEWAPQFQLAANDLNLLATSPGITLNNVLAVVQTLPVKQLKSQTAKLSFEGASLLISLLDVPQLPAQDTATAQSIAKAIADGINTGIEEAAAVSPAPPPKTNAPAAPAN